MVYNDCLNGANTKNSVATRHSFRDYSLLFRDNETVIMVNIEIFGTRHISSLMAVWKQILNSNFTPLREKRKPSHDFVIWQFFKSICFDDLKGMSRRDGFLPSNIGISNYFLMKSVHWIWKTYAVNNQCREIDSLLDSALDSSWLLFIFPMLWCFCFSFLFFTTVYFSILQISPSIFPMLWCLRRTRRRRNLTYLVRLIIFFCWLTANSFDLASFLKRCHIYCVKFPIQ